LAAKNAAKGGAATKVKKNDNTDTVVKTNADGETRPPVLEGQATATDMFAEEQLPTESETSIASHEEQPQSTSMPTISEPFQNELKYSEEKDYSVAIEKQWSQPPETDLALGINELEQLVAAAAAQNQFKEVEEYANISEQQQSINELEQLVAAAAWSAEAEVESIDDISQQTASDIEYYDDELENGDLEEESMNMLNTPKNYNMETNNLRSLVENMKPRRGPMSTNYLDTL
jgi:hypothetical protein